MKEDKKEEIQVDGEVLKEKHGIVFSCDIEIGDGVVKTVHFHQPTRSVMAMASMNLMAILFVITKSY